MPSICFQPGPAAMPVFALWYLHSAEGRRLVEGWELRLLLAGAGVLFAYVVFRCRRPSHPQPARRTVFNLIFGAIAALALWLALDLWRGERFLFEVWAVFPPQEENEIKGTLLFATGLIGWTFAIAELLRRRRGGKA
jgi:hypothetical protein